MLLLSSLSYADDLTTYKALHLIKSDEDFAKLSSAPDSSTFSHTDTVKFIVDRKSKRKLWFFDTRKYTYHYAYARDHLSTPNNPVPDHQLFNQREYSSKNRRFEMGTIVHYKDQNLWVMQLIAGDSLNAQEILRLYKQVRDALWIGAQLRFLPLSAEQEKLVKPFAKRLPLTSADEVFRGVQYQPLTQGKAYGYLRLVRGALDLASVKPNQILVLEKLPEEVPVVAGIISQELQTPLAHIALLCGSRATPNMGLRNALQDKRVESLEGQLVELEVHPQDFSLKPASLEDASIAWRKLRAEKLQVPVANTKEKRLLNVADLRLKNIAFAGAKAAQLGEVAAIKPPLITPGGFVVPLAFYSEHLSNPLIAAQLNAVLNHVGQTRDYKKLDSLRSAIEKTPLDPALLANIKIKMNESGHRGRWILRSSTNAEDLPGFNGAGLYRSIKINADASDQELEDALKKVWSSVWLPVAFEERDWYGVDHRAVGMAALVQPFIEGAVANGVAITANPFAEFRPGVLINVQAKGGSVTGAAGDEIPEQHLVYTFGEQPENELLSTSSRMPDGKVLLNKETLNNLTQQLVSLHERFIGKWDQTANAVDVEFLIMPDNSIVILQARPYRVIYSKDQRL